MGERDKKKNKRRDRRRMRAFMCFSLGKRGEVLEAYI